MRTRVQSLLHKHPVSPSVPGVEPLIDPPLYCVGCGDTESSLQYHRLEDDEPLQVPPSFQQPAQLSIKSPDKAAPNLPTWSVLVVGRHEHEVTPPPLPHHVVRDVPVVVIVCVGVHPVPVDLLDLEVLRGRGVAW